MTLEPQEIIDKANSIIDAIESILKTRGNYLRIQNQVDIKEFIEFVRTEIIKTGLILDSAKLENMKWSKHNVRYGINSLKGMLAEIWATVSWNQLGVKDTCQMIPSVKEEQVAGQDLSFSAPQWHWIYHGQAKMTFFYKDDTFAFPEEWKKYDANFVDRFILCDTFNNIGYCVDYPALLIYVESLDWTRRTSLTLNRKEFITNKHLYHTKTLTLK